MSTHGNRDIAGPGGLGSAVAGAGGVLDDELRPEDPLDRELGRRLDALGRGLMPDAGTMPPLFAAAVRRRALMRRVPLAVGGGLALAAAITLAVVLLWSEKSPDAGRPRGLPGPGVADRPGSDVPQEADDPTLGNMNRATRLGKFEAVTSGASTHAAGEPPMTAGARTLPPSGEPAAPR